MVTDSVLHCVRVISVWRAIYIFQIVVVIGVLVFIPNDKTNRASGGFPFKNTWKKLNFISFFTCSGKNGLSRTATIKFLLYEFFVDDNSCRKSVNHSSNSFSMRLTETCEPKDIAKWIKHSCGFFKITLCKYNKVFGKNVAISKYLQKTNQIEPFFSFLVYNWRLFNN